MRSLRAWSVAGALLVAGARLTTAQSIRISVSALAGDSTSPAPDINVVGSGVPPGRGPGSVELVASLESQFANPFFVQTSSDVDDAHFKFSRLLPEKSRVFLRARLFDALGAQQAETRASYPVRSWLKLDYQNLLLTRTPTFSWESAPITLPPGPWTYTLDIMNVGGRVSDFSFPGLDKTSFEMPTPLDACTSYRWSVTARAVNGDASQVTVSSPGTFVIQTPDCPAVTFFYQNFPNPFGRGTRDTRTCFWFDLAHRASVSLIVYDLQMHPVRRLIPGGYAAVLDSGAYGRQLITANEQTGCDSKASWDGTDDRGRSVPPGVYIAVFEADGVRQTKKVFYRGR